MLIVRFFNCNYEIVKFVNVNEVTTPKSVNCIVIIVEYINVKRVHFTMVIGVKSVKVNKIIVVKSINCNVKIVKYVNVDVVIVRFFHCN